MEGIDGYSRTIVYLRCSTNHLASTVMASYSDAVSRFGVPDKVRSDLGGENVDVWRYMYEQQLSQSVVLVGSSTHIMKGLNGCGEMYIGVLLYCTLTFSGKWRAMVD